MYTYREIFYALNCSQSLKMTDGVAQRKRNRSGWSVRRLTSRLVRLLACRRRSDELTGQRFASRTNATTFETYILSIFFARKKSGMKEGKKMEREVFRCIFRGDSFSRINARTRRGENISRSNSLLQHGTRRLLKYPLRCFCIRANTWKFERQRWKIGQSYRNVPQTTLLIRRWKTLSSLFRFKESFERNSMNHSMIRNRIFRTYFFFSFFFCRRRKKLGNERESLWTWIAILFLPIS